MNSLGSNLGYVDELYARFREDPNSVSEAWREFFADYNPGPGQRAQEIAAAAAVVEEPSEPVPPSPSVKAPARKASRTPGAPAPAPTPSPEASDDVISAPDLEGAEPIRGAAARIAENMTGSLSIPTATSARTIPVRLLEENRRLINQHQAAVHSFKVSFTHLIAWAMVRALEKHPAMNAGYVEVGGIPHRLPRQAIHLGLAIDVERRGERILYVPNMKDAGKLDFPSFAVAYDSMVLRARQGKLNLEDFRGTTVTLTNPGTIGTALSVPRLMAGQGAIVGTGVIGYPAQYSGMSPQVIAELGISKVMTVTSTYDHRIIQGAESGGFLLTLEKSLQGDEGFYDRILKELGVPNEPVRWSGDQSPTIFSSAGSTEAIEKQAKVIQLIRSYRVRGHLWADLNPLGYEPEPHPDLEISHYGLTLWDMDRKFITGGLAKDGGTRTLREILDILRETYCRKIGVEFMHIPEPEIRAWLQERMETNRIAEPLGAADRERIIASLNAAEAFERFLHTTYVGHKRFSLEGAETLIPMLDTLLVDAAAAGLQEVVMGMAHRGRLNVLTNIVGTSYGSIFRKFEGEVHPDSTHGSGDVKYHLGASGTFTAPGGREVKISVASNPSHLEAVDPVVEGMARARQDILDDSSRDRILPVLIHGDAAFAGQGVVAETLNLSQLKGYHTGGTIHIIVNNQIGFTTGPADARSSFYPTDVAKMVRAPVFHVNGDHPEAAVRVMRLALAFRQAFKRDVMVDLMCYRRWGHNEADEPSYTHPVLYAKIDRHRSVRKLYTEDLLRRGDMDPQKAEASLNDFRDRLERAFAEVKKARSAQEKAAPAPRAVQRKAPPPPSTAVPRKIIEEILDGLDRLPQGFKVHPKLAKQIAQRRERFEADKIDWALGEAFAYGALVLDGIPVRLSGEDSGRGTFSQRHAILYDYGNGAPHVPLAHLRQAQAPFQIIDSLLSEFAVLGFEYGYSVNFPEALVLWEAQFGDFVNGAQVIIDQFIASAEEKWNQKSGLTLLLPHGYEGQGPDHSSARMERFLQLAARDNMDIAYPSTPAQYFHLLCRQVRRKERRPLVVFTPKSLLRHPDAVSPAEAFTGGAFEEVLDDPRLPPADQVRRVILSTGKFHYDLETRRRDQGIEGAALIRLEQLYPFPAGRIAGILSRYASAEEILWAQEEPRNMGAWTFVADRLREALGGSRPLRFLGRVENPSPATGSHKMHHVEEDMILEESFKGLPRRSPPEPEPGKAPAKQGSRGTV